MTELTHDEMSEIDGGILLGAVSGAGVAFLIGYGIGTALYHMW